jgi:hypothetical protein
MAAEAGGKEEAEECGGGLGTMWRRRELGGEMDSYPEKFEGGGSCRHMCCRTAQQALAIQSVMTKTMPRPMGWAVQQAPVPAIPIPHAPPRHAHGASNDAK